jgi:hypothetical protein
VAGNANSTNYLVAWTKGSTGNSQIAAWELTSAGAAVGYETNLGGVAAAKAAIAGGPAGDFLVAFEDHLSGATRDIYGWLWGMRRTHHTWP